jgi:hypothetical protein
MTDDPLSQYRKQGTTPHRQPEDYTPENSKRYQAFAGKDNQRRNRLDIRGKDGMAHAVGYSFIIEIVYDRRTYTGILLVLTTMLVKVKGRGLRPIVDALKLGTCEFIQEFDAEEFDAPDADNGPYVESIEVISAAEQRAQGKQPTAS